MSSSLFGSVGNLLRKKDSQEQTRSKGHNGATTEATATATATAAMRSKLTGRQKHWISYSVNAFVVGLYVYLFIWRQQTILSDYLQLHQAIDFPTGPSPVKTAPIKFILFKPIAEGQGAGNVIAGLLAAHLLAEEFGRTVCVSQEYTQFLAAFQPIHASSNECFNISAKAQKSKTINLLNYGNKPPNECALADILNSSAQVLNLVGNTYPRWPLVPDNYFLNYYQPTPQLLAILPWQSTKSPPHTVVHLRKGDDGNDRRKGLDNASLTALEHLLPADTYLVTNEVEYFQRFKSWRNSGWLAVNHNAVDNVDWSHTHIDKDTNTMQLWADWYTILMAKKVIHTHSDFSISAIHWMNIRDTKTILGMTSDGELELVEESWRRDGDTIPLKDRNRVAGASGVANDNNDMRLCHGSPGFITDDKIPFGTF